jgi:hypothetical protein
MSNTPYTPERRAELDARIAERAVIETRRLAALGEAATNLAAIRRLNLKPMNANLLWAEWEFYKALTEWDGDDTYVDAFDDACHALGVDAEGMEAPVENFGMSHPDAGRGFRIGGAA